MLKSKSETKEFSLEESFFEKQKNERSEHFFNNLERRYGYDEVKKRYIMLVINSKGAKKEEEEEGDETGKKSKKEVVVAKRLTEKEKEKITAKVTKELEVQLTLPPPPYEIITPAPSMSHFNAAELCQYIAPLLVSEAAIPAFAAASPTLAFCQGLYDGLFPLSNIGPKISTSDQSTRDALMKQLRDNWYSNLKWCAGEANGNMALYLLIGSKVKRKGTKTTGQLAKCVMKLSDRKGQGLIGVSCKEIAGAKGYIVWWGKTPLFDATTWSSQPGASTQVISTNIIQGELIYVVIIAYKGDGSMGAVCTPQSINVPFS